MLFSNKDIVQLLNSKFECAWQELRPVPQVKIDFGTGHTLRRTLAGNVATWITTEDGKSVDVIPALAKPATYVARLSEALALHERIARLAPNHARSAVQEWHAAKSQAKPAVASPKLAAKRAGAAVVAGKTLKHFEIKRPTALRALSKSRVERPIKKSFLVKDDIYNTTKRQPLAHKMLADNPFLAPSVTTFAFFREILNVDLRDPYLGLAPYVLGGEKGRS